jgi:hypothetical protein
MFQFIRIEAYAAVSGASQQLGRQADDSSAKRIRPSMMQIIAEAFRVESASPHVSFPTVPKLMFGLPQNELELHLNQLKASGKDKLGRKTRRDALLLLAGVASYPQNEAVADQKSFEHWLTITISFLKTKYGENLKSIVLHTDEANPHIHFFCTPTQKPSGEIEHIGTIHDGIGASSAIKTDSSKVRKYAYDKAMRNYQQEYHTEVGLKVGMTRIGPRQTGMPRKQWLQTQDAAKRQMVFIENQNKAEVMHNIVNKKAAEVDARAQQLESKEEELSVKVAAIAERESRVAKRESDLVTKEKVLADFYLSIKNALDTKGKSLVDFFQKSVAQLNEAISGYKLTIKQLRDEVKGTHLKYTQAIDSIKYSNPEVTMQRYELHKNTVANDNQVFIKLLGLLKKKDTIEAERLITKTLNKSNEHDI